MQVDYDQIHTPKFAREGEKLMSEDGYIDSLLAF